MNKKVLLVSGLIVLLAGFFAYEKLIPKNSAPTEIINNQQQNVSSGNPPVNNQPTPVATTSGLKDGTYLGSKTSSIFGPAQVQLVISGGKITDVRFPVFPNDRSTTMMKSNMAMAGIKQEIIRAQSVNVNTISGATQTADSFIESATSAIAKAS